jgi:hypothetical protein
MRFDSPLCPTAISNYTILRIVIYDSFQQILQKPAYMRTSVLSAILMDEKQISKLKRLREALQVETHTTRSGIHISVIRVL